MHNFHLEINYDLDTTIFILLKTSKSFSYRFYVQKAKQKLGLDYSL